MATMGKEPEVWFEQWRMLLHGLAKDIWLEVLYEDSPEDDGAVFKQDEDVFIKAMGQYILQFYPRQGAKTLQHRAMANYEFKFKRGTEVTAHMTWSCTILKCTERLP